MPFKHRTALLGTFANHKVAANLLMVMMIVAGAGALTKLNAQFFPNFELEYITVRVVWNGGSPEDVEASITIPLEQELRTLEEVKTMTSTSSNAVSVITLEYEEGADMGVALDQVEERVRRVRNLPSDAEEPAVSRIFRSEPVARVLVTGPKDLAELRPLVRRMERALLDRGLAKVEISGLPEEEMAIRIPLETLEDLGLGLADIGRQVAAASRDQSAGRVGRDDVARQIRTLDQRRAVLGFENLPVLAANGRRVALAEIAEIERRPREDTARIRYRGQPAVELFVKRDEAGDSLESARIIADWVEETRPGLPPGVQLLVFDETWSLLRDRIDLLLKNGAGGLALVIIILFLFLSGRVAFWVMVGIPVSFMATLAILYLVGGSINMISLFAMIMALGIIVDDAIVVGEDAMTHYQTGEDPLQAAEGGARRMLAPVMSSSLTTISAFIPLLAVGGIIGDILHDIPVVIICVIIASLVECFLILPGHLQHSFRRAHGKRRSWPLRRRLDESFNRFRDRIFRPVVTAAVRYRASTIAAAVGSMILVVGLFMGGRVPFSFFPGIEGNIPEANASFVAGTPPGRVEAYVEQVERALLEAESGLGGGLIHTHYVRHGRSVGSEGRPGQTGAQYGSLFVELIPSDRRGVRNEDFMAAWRERVGRPPGLENFTISARKGGPPGKDLEVRLSNAPAEKLKAASLELQNALGDVTGVSAVEDDMPYGPRQWVLRLTPHGESLGLRSDQIGAQLRAAFDGYLAQIFTEGDEEIEVRVMLSDAQRHDLGILDALMIRLPDGRGSIPLGSVVTIETRAGFDALRHTEAARSVTVFGDVDRRFANADALRNRLNEDVLPVLARKYVLDYDFEGRAKDQKETLEDMVTGAGLALVLIYLVLAWVFANYGWPLVVMFAIPFGMVGAVIGHLALGIDLTILSLFGFFGLSGIVVNDSIILVVFYKHLREKGMSTVDAIVEAACRRLRAVMLTSLTTIAGLSPLLFETSFQAQFLIPMAVTIAFGLAFATLLVLLVVPALLSLQEDLVGMLTGRRGELAADGKGREISHE